MKIWIDDLRPAPAGFKWIRSVNEAKSIINNFREEIEIISIDHDAGSYAVNGGDYIRLLDWLEAMNMKYPIHIHSMNPVGAENMRAIIHHNNWIEILSI